MSKSIKHKNHFSIRSKHEVKNPCLLKKQDNTPLNSSENHANSFKLTRKEKYWINLNNRFDCEEWEWE